MLPLWKQLYGIELTGERQGNESPIVHQDHVIQRSTALMSYQTMLSGPCLTWMTMPINFRMAFHNLPFSPKISSCNAERLRHLAVAPQKLSSGCFDSFLVHHIHNFQPGPPHCVSFKIISPAAYHQQNITNTVRIISHAYLPVPSPIWV